VNPKDDEDLALTLSGKKKKINRKDFESAFSTMKLDARQQTNIFTKMEKVRNKWIDFIQISFLSPDFKEKYIQLINERFDRLKYENRSGFAWNQIKGCFPWLSR
jgi:serine/threonine-protein kinase HipA